MGLKKFTDGPFFLCVLILCLISLPLHGHMYVINCFKYCKASNQAGYLASLSHLLDKAQAFSQQKGIRDEVLLNARLAPDMNPLIWQFQMVSEFSARCLSRLAEIEIPNYPYTETTCHCAKGRAMAADRSKAEFGVCAKKRLFMFYPVNDHNLM